MAHFRNLAYGIVRTAPSPATSGTTLVLETGHGARFPATPFQATVWPVTAMPDPTNAEIVQVNTVVGDTFTFDRAQEGSIARAIQPEDQIAATLTTAYLTDVPLKSDATVAWAGSHTIAGALAVGGTMTAANVTATATLTGVALACQTIQAGTVILSPSLRGYNETWQTATIATDGVIAIPFGAGNHVFVTRDRNVTGLTVTGLPGSGLIAPIMVYYVANGAGPFSVLHVVNGVTARFPNNNTPLPAMSPLAGRIDRILYTTRGDGSWYGDIIGLNH